MVLAIPIWINIIFKYEVLKNGLVIKSGTIDISLAPQSKKQVKLELPKITAEDGVEYLVEYFCLYQRRN